MRDWYKYFSRWFWFYLRIFIGKGDEIDRFLDFKFYYEGGLKDF